MKKYRLPSPVVTPLNTFVPKEFFEVRGCFFPDEVKIQRKWNNKNLESKREQHRDREQRWGITDPRVPKVPVSKRKLGGVWKDPVDSGVATTVDQDEDMNDDDLADDENDTSALPVSRTHDESSAIASVGDPTEEARREPAQIRT